MVISSGAQGTAFTYQGQLNSGGTPASGNYDFTFSLFNNNTTNTGQVGNTLTNLDVGVTNGLFTVILDFGANFPGASRWLAIGVRTNSGVYFTALNPLQELTPAPYAVFAGTASTLSGTLSAAQLSGPVPPTEISGAYSSAVTFSNSANNFAGTFSGDGSGLTNLPLAYVNVLKAGVTNDGVTDVTVPLQNLLNKGGAFYFPAGRYYAQELILTNNTTLLGSGAVLVYATNASNNKVFVSGMLNSNINISNLGFDGGDYSAFYSRTFNTSTGIQDFSVPYQYYYWNPLGLRHGLQFNCSGGGAISGICIYGFSGIGLLPVEGPVNQSASLKTVVNGVTCYSNFTGLFSSGVIGNPLIVGTNIDLPNWITNYVPGGVDPEFMSYSGLNLYNNTVGLCASAGNCTYVNSIIDANLFGQLDSYGYNDHHGSINSIIYTHNIAAALYIAGSENGEQIINCQFRDNINGAITLNDAEGVTIDHCTFGPLSITNQNTYGMGQNFFPEQHLFGHLGGTIFSNGRISRLLRESLLQRSRR